MKLTAHLQQSHLHYLIRDKENIVIRENNDYLFLCFDDITQSVMLKRKPQKLTLTHQYFIMLPMLFITPKRVIEFGLGGGNLSRFVLERVPSCQWLSIESNQQVIQCFTQYFNPSNLHFPIYQQDAQQWLTPQDSIDADWLIFDIYQNKVNDADSLALIREVLSKLSSDAWLTINLVNLAEDKLNKVLSYLAKLKRGREMSYFFIPRYTNIIVHLHPAIDTNNTNLTSLKKHHYRRGQALWLHRQHKR